MGNAHHIKKARKEYFDRRRTTRPDYDAFALETFSKVKRSGDILPETFILPKLHLRIYGNCPNAIYSLIDAYQHAPVQNIHQQNISTSNPSLYQVLDKYGVKLDLNLYPYIIDSPNAIDSNKAGLHYVVYEAKNRNSYELVESLLRRLSESPRCHYGSSKYIALICIYDPTNKDEVSALKEAMALASKHIASFFYIALPVNESHVKEAIDHLIIEYADDQLRNLDKKRQEIFDYVEEQRKRAFIHNVIYETKSEGS